MLARLCALVAGLTRDDSEQLGDFVKFLPKPDLGINGGALDGIFNGGALDGIDVGALYGIFSSDVSFHVSHPPILQIIHAYISPAFTDPLAD
jgi:hypothetical protein